MLTMIDLATPVVRGFAAIGLRVGRISSTLNYKRSQTLKRLGVTVVLDIGANEGQYSQYVRRSGYDGRIVSFEPLEIPFQKLRRYAERSQNHECRHCAIGNADEITSIYVSENTVSSSLLEVRGESVQACPSSACVGVETVEVRRLDSIRNDILRPSDRVHLKVDTQGTEMNVLFGAREMLSQVVSIELEMSLTPLYKDQLLLPQVCEQLWAWGFKCVWLENGFTDAGSGHLLQVDGLFVRSETGDGAS